MTALWCTLGGDRHTLPIRMLHGTPPRPCESCELVPRSQTRTHPHLEKQFGKDLIDALALQVLPRLSRAGLRVTTSGVTCGFQILNLAEREPFFVQQQCAKEPRGEVARVPRWRGTRKDSQTTLRSCRSAKTFWLNTRCVREGKHSPAHSCTYLFACEKRAKTALHFRAWPIPCEQQYSSSVVIFPTRLVSLLCLVVFHAFSSVAACACGYAQQDTGQFLVQQRQLARVPQDREDRVSAPDTHQQQQLQHN